MEILKEVQIPINSLPKMIKIKDLIYFEGPLLSHFESIYKENFLFYWVDSNEVFNRWLIFRTTNELIDDYLERKISLYNLISDKNNGSLYKVDIDGNLDFNNLSIIVFENIPSSYLPEKNSYYTFGVINSSAELKNISEKENVGILQAYYNESSKIGKGIIDLEILGSSLNDLANINKGIRKAFIIKERTSFNNSKPRHSNNKDFKFDEQSVLQAASFNYFGNTSRSFGALFKPASQQASFSNLVSLEDRYIEFFIHFFEYSTNIEKFVEFIKDIDKNVVDSYKKLLTIIKKSKIQFNLNYENSASNFSISKKINFTQAGEILNNLNNLDYDNSREIYLTGRFIELHLKTGHYQFETVSEDQKMIEISNGYLDADRKEMAWKIKWDKLYDVIISRREEKKTGQKKAKVGDVIISFIELDKTLPLSE